MRLKIFLVFLITAMAGQIQAQEHTPWREVDRKFLLANLTRTREELTKETETLTKAQWNFKESADRWSINEVLEHLMRWELLFDHEITNSLEAGLQPARMKTAPPDSSFVNFILEEKPNHSFESTKQFTYAIPIGHLDPESTMEIFLKMRGESMAFVKTTKDDLRAYFNSYGSIHQIYIYVYGHTDRHLRQIKRIKKDPNFPKN